MIELKTWPQYYELVASGKKKFEIRYWSRFEYAWAPISEGQIIKLVEHERRGPCLSGPATGRACSVIVTGPVVCLADIAHSDPDSADLLAYYCFGIQLITGEATGGEGK